MNAQPHHESAPAATARAGSTIDYFDCFCGVSGDMILGALVDAGLDPNLLRTELDKLALDGVSLRFETTSRQGIRATRASLVVADEGITHDSEHHFHRDPVSGQPAAGSALASVPATRHLRDIVALLETSDLDEEVKSVAKDIFTRLAAAEAEVHGARVEEIHFHEVGALDAVVDVVGAVVGLRLLNVDVVYSSALHCGTGTPHCAHGTLPVPVPAVIALCRNVPMVQTDVTAELVTPTGAAIVTTLAAAYAPNCQFEQTSVGYGAGSRNLETRPNVLRIRLGTLHGEQSEPVDRHAADDAMLIEANIDDMNPEIYGYLFDRLLEEGAHDVYVTPVHMKKGRPGNVLGVLVKPADTETMADLILRETTTIGLRFHRVERRVLERSMGTVTTPFGELRIKVSAHLDGSLKRTPEYEDCARLARTHNVPLLTVYTAAISVLDEA